MHAVLSTASRVIARATPVRVLTNKSFTAPRAAALRVAPKVGATSSRFFAASAAATQTVQKGDKVAIHYVGTLDDGEQFDSSRERGEPISFTVGGGMMIPGFDNGVMGMAIGELKTLNCVPKDAYGEINPANVMKVPKQEVMDAVGEEYTVVGSKLMVGQGMTATISEVSDTECTLDCNHPLAGKTLNFDIELVSLERLEVKHNDKFKTFFGSVAFMGVSGYFGVKYAMAKAQEMATNYMQMQGTSSRFPRTPRRSAIVPIVCAL